MMKRATKYRLRGAVCALVFALSGAAMIGCGSDDKSNGGTPTEPTYADLVASGWLSFTMGNFADAERHFGDAIDFDTARAEGHSGLGWSSLRMNDPASADLSFDTGSTGTGEPSVMADPFAGWAFATNALKDPAGVDDTNYSESNARATEVLDVDADWSFTHGLGLDRRDLIVLRAENFFALGEFAASLAEVQLLDPGFSIDAGAPAGQAALAARVELLKDEVGRHAVGL